MSEQGLIGRLRVDLSNLYIPAGCDPHIYRANAVGRDNGIEEVLILLRSDETREALAEAIWHTHAPDILLGADEDLRNVLRAESDAVIRVLTGEATDG